MILSNIIFGLIGIGIGYALIRFAFVITENTSSIGWVESFMGAGRTVDFYRILGFVIIILSMLLSVGLLLPLIRGSVDYVANLLHL
jgi:hypothetical protein